MSIIHSCILGIVEGITEFLPVSSTGHLLIVEKYLNLQGPGIKAFSIVIQLGALLAAMVYYRQKIKELLRSFLEGDLVAKKITFGVCVAIFPTLLIGFLLKDFIKMHLFSVTFIAGALIFWGIFILFIELYKKWETNLKEQKDLSLRDYFIIGLFQTFSLWPGTSRSAVTLVASQLCGVKRETAVDFSFLLAIPTLSIASVYSFLTNYSVLKNEVGVGSLLIGLIVSFIVSMLVIHIFLKFIKRFGFFFFGIYRVTLGGYLLLTF